MIEKVTDGNLEAGEVELSVGREFCIEHTRAKGIVVDDVGGSDVFRELVVTECAATRDDVGIHVAGRGRGTVDGDLKE